ncbi:MAG: DUF47 family protein [Chlamydiales bacterium]|nr:DUF47 family protein [Chlamydiales bacterium]
MFGRFLPREVSFFDFFQQQGELTVRCAREFLKLIDNPSDIEAQNRVITNIEHDADTVTHRCVEALHKTFLTPIERDDIFRLVSRMDDIVDYIEAASQRIALYKVKTMTDEVRQVAEVLVKVALEVEQALTGLRNLKNSNAIRENCIAIKHLENEAGDILHRAIARLFDEEPETRTVIKWKEIYDKLEGAIDRCEDVAGIIEGVILEHG